MKKTPWIVRFLRWTLGTDDAPGIPDADFSLHLDIGILVMCRIADRPLNETCAAHVGAAKIRLSEAFSRLASFMAASCFILFP